MAARRKASSPQQAQNKKQSDVVAKSSNAKSSSADGAVTTTTPMTSTNKNNALADAHLPPLGLVAATLLCSGFLLVLALRDFCTTGRNLLGNVDEAFLLYTKSTDWYDDSQGWKSTQGGFSAVSTVSTDANNMGGFLVRKGAGATALGWTMFKLWPLLVHTAGVEWQLGHYRPLLWTGATGNVAIALFVASYLPQWQAEGVADQWNMTHWAYLIMAVLVLEAVVWIVYAVSCPVRRGPAHAMPAGKTPRSLPSNIVTRTTVLVSGAMLVLSVRDLLFPGMIMDFWPRDDVYLEWTNALQHSPRPGSPEWHQHGLDAPLFVGDKFIAQYMAVNLMVISLAKMGAALFIRLGPDGRRGTQQAKLFWQGACLADAVLVFLLRIFTPAASSASCDLRYPLMAVAYETFMLGLYGFF